MNCRMCKSNLETIIDLGEQCLSGQFPKIDEPDQPRYPLVLGWCPGCGLIQLRHTVDPKLLFSTYWYRSGITQTMRNHLRGIVTEAIDVLGRTPEMALDIGCNDGTLLSCLPKSCTRIGVDPSSTGGRPGASEVVRDFYPCKAVATAEFDLIFSIACFYDVDDPVAFAKAVRDNLAPDGIWCCEVADANQMVAKLSYDAICHEHLTYYTGHSFANVMARAGLHIVSRETNDCNGGSRRFYMKRDPHAHVYPHLDHLTVHDYAKFAADVAFHRQELLDALDDYRSLGKKVHLLGASTKANTILQYCGVTPDFVQYASDRDPRKVGRCTPGTRIPIISEEESRDMKPDVYVIGPAHFRTEIIEREQAFLDRGGVLLFTLPLPEEFRK